MAASAGVRPWPPTESREDHAAGCAATVADVGGNEW